MKRMLLNIPPLANNIKEMYSEIVEGMIYEKVVNQMLLFILLHGIGYCYYWILVHFLSWLEIFR